MKWRPWKILTLLICSLIIYYWPNFYNFFFQDDFFNMVLAKNQNLLDAFNIFKRPAMDFSFYRPFSTQLYWTVGQKLFAMSPLGYHLVNFGFFAVGILLVYKLTLQIWPDKKLALLTSFFYGFAASHFYRLFFISQFQELSLAVFTMATFLLFFKRSLLTPVMFALALTTKETAVMIVPVIFVAITLLKLTKRRQLIIFLLCFAILLVYFAARIFFFGYTTSGVYEVNFKLSSILNNYFWYSLWSLGIPETFVNVEIFRRPTIINSQVLFAFGREGQLVIAFFLLFVGLIFKPVLRTLKHLDRNIFLMIFFFTLFLLPVAFYPFHKFPYSLAVPLFASSFLLAYVVRNLSRPYLLAVCLAYFVLSQSAYYLNLTNHWVVKKAVVGKKVFAYFQINYPIKPTQPNIYFRNTTYPWCPVGVHFSQEVSYGIGDKDGLRLLYQDDNLQIYYEDIDHFRNYSESSLIIDSRIFF